MTVLVAYATCHGSTRGVAERIAHRLRLAGVEADVRPAGDVVDVAGYEAVVLGSAVHGGRWLAGATGLARGSSAALRDRPTFLFSVSTVGDEESMFPPRVARRLRAMRKETPELVELRRILRPMDHRNFAGAISPAHWSLAGRLFFRALGGRYGDHRSWGEIDRWGDHIAARVMAGPDHEEPKGTRAARP